MGLELQGHGAHLGPLSHDRLDQRIFPDPFPELFYESVKLFNPLLITREGKALVPVQERHPGEVPAAWLALPWCHIPVAPAGKVMLTHLFGV